MIWGYPYFWKHPFAGKCRQHVVEMYHDDVWIRLNPQKNSPSFFSLLSGLLDMHFLFLKHGKIWKLKTCKDPSRNSESMCFRRFFHLTGLLKDYHSTTFWKKMFLRLKSQVWTRQQQIQTWIGMSRKSPPPQKKLTNCTSPFFSLNKSLRNKQHLNSTSPFFYLKKTNNKKGAGRFPPPHFQEWQDMSTSRGRSACPPASWRRRIVTPRRNCRSGCRWRADGPNFRLVGRNWMYK